MIIEVANAASDDDCRLLTTIYDRQLHLTNARGIQEGGFGAWHVQLLFKNPCW
jgi:hypothetical protein